MEGQWSLIDYQELIKSILNGNRCIQEPIAVNNKRRDERGWRREERGYM